MASLDLHPDRYLNYELLRVAADAELDAVKEVAPRIRTYADWHREMTGLGERALARGQKRLAATYLRASEFYMDPTDPKRYELCERFTKLFYEGCPLAAEHRVDVPYGTGALPCIHLPSKASAPKGTILLHAGFDAFMEEFFECGKAFWEAGYSVVLFDGPGQGMALKRFKLPMTHEWERPVAAVLDHFGLGDVALVGISLGGYLALRAAAFEPRIQRVVAFDVMYDFFACIVSRRGAAAERLGRAALALHAGRLLDRALAGAMRFDPVTWWGIQQGMHITGTATPHEFLSAAKHYHTRDVSRLVTQDVLVMAGAEDHFIPLEHFAEQLRLLTNARSVTGRLFTRAERGEDHCQIGNLPLAVRTILNWLDERRAS